MFDLELNPERLEVFGQDYISTPLYERDIAISPDGNQLIYTLGNYKQTNRSLVSIKKTGDKWGDKEILPFSGKFNDIEPFFTVDGTKLFFASNRPMDKDSTRSDYNIWYVEQENGKWNTPIPLDTLVNSPGDEFYPSVSSNGNLYFTATRTDGIGREDIYLSTFSKGKHNSPVPLDSTVNTRAYEFNAYISPDEDLLVFSSYGRLDGLGGGDLYYSRKDKTGKWGKAENLGEIVNSDKLDYCPFIDFPRNNFYFTSDRAKDPEDRIKTVPELTNEANKVLNGMGNIYRINMDKLNLNYKK
ncbi:MAG: PD40 domain-containing protein [Flavobacteriaceae bacterium]|nr:MAG: PD40 domain-containing protein [Flavobacteriaceae bacterium]